MKRTDFVTQEPNGNFNPEFQEILQAFLWGDVDRHGTLSCTEKALLRLVALTAGRNFHRLGAYTHKALEAGATPVQIQETFYQCAPYVGLETIRAGLEEVERAFTEAGVTLPLARQATVTEDTRFEQGLAVQKFLFGDTIDEMRASAPPELQHIQDYLSAHCFGDFYTRNGLELKFRELVTFCAICCLGGCEPQAQSHAVANLSLGNSRETLIEAVTQCLPFVGFPRTLNAINCINVAASRVHGAQS